MHQTIVGNVQVGQSKMVVIVGGLHAARAGLEHANLADLLAADTSLQSTTLFVEKDLNEDVDIRRRQAEIRRDIPSYSVNSALYTALAQHGAHNVGFDLTARTLQDPAGFEMPPFDGYIMLGAAESGRPDSAPASPSVESSPVSSQESAATFSRRKRLLRRLLGRALN